MAHEAAIERLAGLVRVPTVSRVEAETTDWAAFDRLRSVLEAQYPLVHARLERELVAERTLVYRWAGRDPAAVQVWSCYATVPDTLDEETRLRRTIARLATYLQVYGDLLVRTNAWDPAALQRFRDDPVVAGLSGWADIVATRDEIEHIAGVLPEAWTEAAATGSAQECARRVRAQLDLGVDGVIMHCSTPAELEPVIGAYVAGG